ncbi:MAG: BglG family transcription antiterminator [Vagococcus sp.]|uniref:BglG family transcription antiterminator n=2 Tax=Enterococcaceae TaxID=81852 RepID=UPI002FC83B4A
MMLMDQRSKNLIEKLIENTHISHTSLQDCLGVTKQQLDYVIEKVNDLLVDSNLPTIYTNAVNVILPKESRHYFLELFASDGFWDRYELNASERKSYIFLMLIYYVDDYLSINHFLDALKVGKTTLISDLRKLEKDLEKEQIEIVYSRKDGYQLNGDESNIRNYIMKQILDDFSAEDSRFIYQFFIRNEKILTYQKVKDVTKEFLIVYDLDLVENRLNEFCYIFLVLLPRLNKSHQVFYDKFHFPSFYKMKEYLFAKDLLTAFDIDNKEATLYICCWLLGNAVGDNSDLTKDHSIIKELVERIVHRFEMLSGVRFKDKNKVIKQLYSHFRPTYYRLFFNFPIINVLHDKIVQEYAELFQIVKKTMTPIGNLLEIEIPDDEISFLTIHFASLIKNYEEYHVSQKVGVVVCPNGIGSSLIVYNELKTIFPDIIFLGPFEMHELGNIQSEFDMIFTTVPNMRLYSFGKPVYVVSPIMTDEERYKLVHTVHTKKMFNPGQYVDVNQLLKIIESHSDIKNKSKLEKEISSFLKQDYMEDNFLEDKKESGLDLLDLLQEDFIQLNVETNSWEEALYVAATPMLKKGVITRKYIDEIIRLTRQEGPYMVITTNVALPHARPEEGAKKLGLGITVLNKEVDILNQSTMKYIFTLSAVDNHQHLTAISELVTLIDKPEFFKMLDESKNSGEVIEWIESYLSRLG